MSETSTTFRITTEDEAFEILDKALKGAISDDDLLRVEFVGWPRMDVHLPLTPLNGSISPTMMEAFIEFQTTIYRAYLLLNLENGDLRSLTKPEKDHLEFRVKVSEGSSDYTVQLAKMFNNIAASMVAKMSSTELLIGVIGVAAIIGGNIAWKNWLTAKTEQRRLEADTDAKKQTLDSHKAALETNLEQARILATAFARQPALQDVDASAEPARQQIVKAVAEEKGGTVQGVALSQDFAAEVVTQKRQYGTPTTFSGVYTVSNVNTTVPDGFRVTLSDTTTNNEISASLQDALVSEDHRVALREAEWSKRPVTVRMSARLLRNRYVDAVVLQVSPFHLSETTERSVQDQPE